MRVTFVDETGRAGDTEFVGMAACDARWSEWQVFNERWRSALAESGAPFLHMKDFAGSRGPYRGWTELQRRKLMSGCLASIDGLKIHMFAAVMRCADFFALPAAEREAFADPYLCVFQECLHGIALGGYLEPIFEKVDLVYSQQDEFKTKFQRMFLQWKYFTQDGPSLGMLAFCDMRESPGLQLADLIAYEMLHFYHLRETRPDLKARHPFARLCEHQMNLKAGGFKYIPGWKFKLKAYGAWQPVQHLLWTDVETWLPLLRQLAPEIIMPDWRIRRLATLGQAGAVEALRARQIQPEY